MLELERLSKTYADGTHALADVTLEVRESEIVSVVGGSGCGKTTLLRLIAGLDRPSAGAILLDGERLSEPHPAVGIVFQEPRLLPWLTVADNVGFGLDDRSAAERRDRVGHALRRVGLIEHARRGPRRPGPRGAAGRPAGGVRDPPPFGGRAEGAPPRGAVLGARRLHPGEPA